MKFLFQSFLLLLSFGFVYIWQNTSLAGYTLQTFSFLIILYLVISFFKKDFKPINPDSGSFSSIFILNAIIFLFIFSTGAFKSPFFFLLYFLGFGISFVFKPGTIFVFVLGAVLLFFPEALKDDVVINFIKLGSIALISPIAYFFGRQFRDEEVKDREITTLKQKVNDMEKKASESSKKK